MSGGRLVRSLFILLPMAVLAASCRPPVNVKEAVEITEVSSGWFDAGIVEGKNKIVPSVSLRLQKQPDVNLDSVAVNVIFRRPPSEGNEEEEWDEVFIQNAKFTESNQTPLLVVRAEKGYTGDPPQSRMDLLQHSQFRDVRATIFAKYGSTQWVELGRIDVERQLLTR